MKAVRAVRMDARKTKVTRRRLLGEYEKLIQSINRNRTAEGAMKLEHTEDEGDLASINHDRGLLYNLHDSSFARLRIIEEAIEALDRGDYGQCARCRKDINQRRLEAVPWATMCISCQENVERECALSPMVLSGLGPEEKEW